MDYDSEKTASSFYLKMARIKKSTTSSVVKVELLITSDRFIKGGHLWFENHHKDDYFKIWVEDSNDSVLRNFYDDEAASDNQGWYFNNDGFVEIKPLILGAQLSKDDYLVIEATKGDGSEDTLRGNIHWG